MGSPGPCSLPSPGSTRSPSTAMLSAPWPRRSSPAGKALLPRVHLENKHCSFKAVLEQDLEKTKSPSHLPFWDPHALRLSYKLWRVGTSTVAKCLGWRWNPGPWLQSAGSEPQPSLNARACEQPQEAVTSTRCP